MIQQTVPGGSLGPVGISDIGVFVAGRGVQVSDVIEGRSLNDPALRARLDRANGIAGQRIVRFPEVWEDSVTLAAEAARQVLQREGGLDGLYRLLAVGTETSVDHAKPVAAYVQGLLKAAGLDLGTSLSTLQLQHACAGSTMGLLHTAGFLGLTGRPGERGLVLSTDIARYSSASSGELTQGAGATAVVVEHDAKLLTLDVCSIGQYSMDADDFFRPLGQSAAQVRGGHSIKCYRQALAGALQDHSRRKGQDVVDVIKSTDFFVLHTPFRNMPAMAFEWLLGQHGLDGNGDGLFTRTHGDCLQRATDEIAYVGNLYNGSVYFVLAHLLNNLYQELGRDIVGQRLILGSYGSGSTMLVLSATVAPGAPEVIARWNLPSQTESMTAADFNAFAPLGRGL